MSSSSSILTAAQIADQLGVTTRTVKNHSTKLGVGTKVPGGTKMPWIYTPTEVDRIANALAQQTMGRPTLKAREAAAQ